MVCIQFLSCFIASRPTIGCGEFLLSWERVARDWPRDGLTT